MSFRLPRQTEKIIVLIRFKVIKWTDPESDIQAKKNTFYSPMRIQHEQEAMSSGYSPSRFNLSDWYTFARYPYVHARFTDPPFWHTQQKIKKYEKLVRGQPFIKERLVILGPDLSAANFLCHRQCRVKFKGRDDYTELQLNSFTMPDYVPQGMLSVKRNYSVDYYKLQNVIYQPIIS